MVPVSESNNITRIPTDEAESFLRSNGFNNFTEIVFAMKSDNTSDCMQFPDVRARVIQLCTAQSIIQECQNGTDLVIFHDCFNRECFGQFDEATSLCFLRYLGIEVRTDKQGDDWMCGISKGNSDLFQWQQPDWQKAIGGMNNISCVISQPAGSYFQNRISCQGQTPIIDNRIVFPPNEGLKGTRGQVHCIVKQFCQGSVPFLSQTICFGSPGKTEPEDLLAQVRDLDNEVDADTSRNRILDLTTLLLLITFMFHFINV
eukprot:g5772.t1